MEQIGAKPSNCVSSCPQHVQTFRKKTEIASEVDDFPSVFSDHGSFQDGERRRRIEGAQRARGLAHAYRLGWFNHCQTTNKVVGGLEHHFSCFHMFPYIGNAIIPTDFQFFSG